MAHDLFDLGGKVAVVTGGSRGLGREMVLAFADRGADVVIASRKLENCQAVADEVRARGRRALAVAYHAASWADAGLLAEAAYAEFGTIDILVNNAGATWGAPAEDYPPEAWHKVINLNVNAMFFLSQYVGKHVMIPKKSGKIINISSIAGLAGNPPGLATIAYNTSKGADINFTRALAAEWGRHNINVNAICPGFFPSKMSAGVLQKIEKMVIAATPLQRLGGDEDLMGAIVFLASEASRHVTGQYLAVDGGASTC